MPFTIQGQDVAAVPETQSPWYETDIAILVAGIAGTGVLTGCAVTAQGTPDMTVAVASGTIQPSAGVAAVTVTGANKAITAADGDDPRIDLVSASAAGVLTVTDGTPEPIVPGVSGPKPPDLPSGHIALAMVDVPATDTAIETAQITDKRAMVFAAGGGGLSNQGLATYLDFDGAAAPADPTGDHGRIYAKTDGRIYSRDAGGVEYGPFDAASGGLIAASSDDFAAGTLDEKWTQLGGSLLDVLNTTDTSGQLHMSKTSIGYAVCGIYETAPTPPFVVVAKLASWTLANNYVQAGIMLLDSAPTALRTFGPLYGGYAPAVNDMAFGLWSSRTARASNLDINIVSTAPLWLALVVPTTLLVVPLYSTDGPTWISTPTPATSGLTIAKVGLFVAGNTGGGDVAAYFEWIKCWSLPAFTA